MTCLFCEIIEKKRKAYIIAENKNNLVVLDAFPASKGHTLIITKKHYNNIAEIELESWSKILPLLKNTIAKLKKVFEPAGFNIISNMGEVAYQSISHLHIHVIPKYEKEKGFVWTTKIGDHSFDLEEIAKSLAEINFS